MVLEQGETDWAVWYAWYPVCKGDGGWAWLRDVEWSLQWEGSYGSDHLENHYREIA